MDKFLIFRLYGVMAAWGDIAVGEVRRSAAYPSFSSLVGLLSAALGVKRSDKDILKDISYGYHIAIKVLSPGTLMRDFHTVQVPKSSSKSSFMSRRDELNNKNSVLGTMLTYREYRCDALYHVAILEREKSPYSLEILRNALLKPKFVLYLGRKSCPLSAPLEPQIIQGTGLKDAFNKASFTPLLNNNRGVDISYIYLPQTSIRYYWDFNTSDLKPSQTLDRHDFPHNRDRWQFVSRQEHFYIEEGGD